MNYKQISKRLLLAVAVVCLSAVSVCGQGVTVTVRMNNARLKSVMNEIEAQTNLLFLYTDEIDTNRTVSVNAEAAPLGEVLQSILKGTDTDFRITASNIVLSKRASGAAAGTGPKSVSGTVKDTRGEAIIGAVVMVAGTSAGTTTGLGGEFTVTVPANVPDPQLEVNFFGYDPRTVDVGVRASVDIVLSLHIEELDQVVVTALNIRRAEKALAYNVQQVSAEDVAANRDANFLNALNGKVAGVTINASSSGVGGASRVVMRGPKSINQSSNALYVIDGMPIMTTAGYGRSDEQDSRGQTDPMADINPEDIESISVLTGAAAAALYGSSAANGAIVITTKRGQEGRVAITVSSNTELMTPFVLPRFQNRYGTGDIYSVDEASDRSWGRFLNGATRTGFEPGKDYFQLGVAASESISLSVGNEKNQTYISAAALNAEGVVPNNMYNRYNFSFRNTTKFFKDKFTLDINANYILQEDRNVTDDGSYSNPVVGAYLFPRGDDWEDVKMYERYNVVRKIYEQYWPQGQLSMNAQNPYWINYRNLRENRKDRYMLGAALSFDILDWLSVAGRIRLDNSHNDYADKRYASTNNTLTENSQRGFFGGEKSKDRQIYGEAFVNINKIFNEDWSLSANVGASFIDMKNDAIASNGPIADGSTSEKEGLTNVFNVQNLSKIQSRHLQTGWREQTQSVMGQTEVGFKGTYYLTQTGRNDWPSALAGPHSVSSAFFYPSAGVSILLSNFFKEENLSYLKLRASWASVGSAFSRYIANPLYGWSDASGYSTQTQYPVFDLKPERTQSVEVGVTMRFLKHFNLDVSYYNAHTKNQTFNPQISTSSGASDIIIQTGDVLNTGVELALGFGRTWGKFSWESNYTFSTNKNKILELARNVTNPVTGEKFSKDYLDMGGLGQTRFMIREGGTLGDIYSMADLMRDPNGDVYVNESGQVMANLDLAISDHIKLGTVLPKANMAWRNEFSVAGVNFGFMISARIGGVVFSQTQAKLDLFGVSEASAAARDAENGGGGRFFVNDVIPVSAHDWFAVVAADGGKTIPQYYTYSATNVRLQEASIGYTIPRRWLKEVCDVTVSVVGRNLWMIYNKAPFDPEATASMNNYYQGIDNFMMPSLRNIGFNVRLKF